MEFHIDINYVKGFYPEIEEYLHKDETNYNDFFPKAKTIVINDLRSRSIDTRKLMPKLILKSTGSLNVNTNGEAISETNNRTRYVIKLKTVSPTVTDEKFKIKLQGKDTEAGEVYNEITEIEIASTDTNKTITDVFVEECYFYRYVLEIPAGGGSIDFEMYLIEEIYDLLLTYRVIGLIFLNLKRTDDRFSQAMEIFDKEYLSILQNKPFLYDTDGDGDAEVNEVKRFSTKRMIR